MTTDNGSYRTKYSLDWQSVDFNICGNEMLTPAGLEVQIFVDTKDAKNVPAVLKDCLLYTSDAADE